MLRDLKFLRRNSGKDDEIENVPFEPKDSSAVQASLDSSRAPLNTIPEPTQNTKPEPEASGKSKFERTPVKSKGKTGHGDPTLPLRTPEKHNLGASSKNRFGWPKIEPSKSTVDTYVDPRGDAGHFSSQLSRGSGAGNGGLATPRTTRTVGRANSSYYSESNSTQSTPNRSVNKPPNVGLRNKVDGNGGGRWGNFAALYKGFPSSSCSTTVVNTVEVPHFDLKEDPSFWMEHNVQVLIRVRPLNSTERALNGYSRCLKQESSQTITWIGQPETRFTFDHVACETIDQETLFRMVGLPMVENCMSGYNSCMFAYGQTGSGKTYTMLGEIEDLEMKPSPHRGMTPRIFEFLFARIQAEEETRRAERLKYNCKCSFLEIYNEQITDLLDPSSTNLLLREDVKEGVYVENLSEFEVHTVSDILKLLIQGSSNRKVAATNMNRESSRSHSVFTCVIESRWEKDSTTNLRFARLNLVDLAGSERQKTSGAEGDRLKEAANINKSLSTLGHVIMILVDVANGKPRHVPYRDSRLTFLLQDSLGGNSKTIIIANVSPSMCSAAETLNTLKFAQRAKLIQNNAVVNEDSTGDVIALKNQIHLLKEEVSFLKRQNVARALSFGSISSRNEKQMDEYAGMSSNTEDDAQEADAFLGLESNSMVRMSTKQLKTLETTLAGALRREQMTEASTKQLEAEIELLNQLVRQREEDTRCTKMMLKFREDKIQRMESLLGGSITADTYLLEENKALNKEIQLLQAKLDSNPEVTRFASENIRLSDQLRRFQDFYEEGEREMLLSEVSKLREQLLQSMDGACDQHYCPRSSTESQLKKTLKELEECKRNLTSCLEENAKLNREICDLRSMFEKINSDRCEQDSEKDLFKALPLECDIHNLHFKASSEGCTCAGKHMEDILDLQLELDILNIILKEQRTSQSELEEKMTCLSKDLDFTGGELTSVRKLFDDSTDELNEAKRVIEALESQQILSINEIEDLQNSNYHLKELLGSKEHEITAIKKQLSFRSLRDPSLKEDAEGQNSPMEVRLKKMQESLEKAKQLNKWHQSGHKLHDSCDEETENVRRQAEGETAEVIVCLQEELAILQQQVQDSQLNELEMKKNSVLLENELKVLQEKLHLITEENEQLLALIEEKDREVQALSEEWMLLSAELEEVLGDGDEALRLACDELGHLSGCLPQRRIWISEQCSQIVRTISEKELLIEDLTRCLEEANSKRSNLESMLKSLRGAALVITEAHQQECSEKENKIALLNSELHTKTSLITKLENSVKLTEEKMRRASVCATAAFVVVNRLSEMNHEHLDKLKQKDGQLEELAEMNFKKDGVLVEQAAFSEESAKQSESLRKDLAECQDDRAKLMKELSEEQQHVNMIRQKLEDMEENNILKAKSKLDELKGGLTTVRLCMNMSSEHEETSERIDDLGPSSSDVVSERICSRSLGDYAADLTDVKDLRTQSSDQPLEKQTTICGCSCCLKRLNSRKSRKAVNNRDVTIILLKAEIESALESLKQVQVEMAKLHNEKKERLLYEEQGKETIRCLTNQLLALQAAMHSFEEQGKLKMETYNCKVDALAQSLLETCKYRCKEKEMLEREVGDIEIAAAEKSAEASFILAKFEEAQDTLKEADIMINELMIANEKMKVDIGMLERVQRSLTTERDILKDEVQSLRSVNSEKDLQCERLEKQIASHVMETRDLFGDLETDIAYFLKTFTQSLASLTYEFQIVQSLVLDSTKSVKLWLEDIWSEIVVRDCAVSSLHLCHMGILLETATGLNAENGLLQHGLLESNSLIADLRDHNEKSRKELEMCRVLKGKLLSDIKNSFDCISRKEEETVELSNKLAAFEKMILDLQFQEESMLKRSNYIGHQLTLLTKELDESNKNFSTSLVNQQKQLEAKEEVLSECEHLTVDLYAKEFESLILATEMQEIRIQNYNIEKRNLGYAVALKNIVSEMLLSQIDTELSKQIVLDCMNETCQLKKEIGERERTRLDLLSKLAESNSRKTEMDEMIKALEHDVGLLKEVDISNNVIKAELAELLNSKMRLEHQIEYLEMDNRRLIEEVKNKEIALEYLSNRISVVDQQKKELDDDMVLLKSSSQKLQAELERKNEELSSMIGLTGEHELLKKKILDLEFENNKVLKNLAERKSEVESSFSCIEASKAENTELKERISHCESTIKNLQSNLDVKNADLNELQHTQSFLREDLHLKSQNLQLHADALNKIERENKKLIDELVAHDKIKHDFITNCLQLVDKVYNSNGKLYGKLESRSFICLENVVRQIAEDQEKAARLIEEFECLDSCIKGLMIKNEELESELLRKDDVLKGLQFDISLLQESASNTKDQKDEIEKMLSFLKALEDEFALKLEELEEAVDCRKRLEAQVKEKIDMIGALEQDIIQEQQLRSVLSAENTELKVLIADAVAAKASAEEEVLHGRKVNESLEMELTEMANALDQINSSNKCMKSTLNGVYVERDNFHEEVLKLKKHLEMANAKAQENAVVAAEAQQIAEARESYAREKEEEVKLLEKSVEELEHTLNVLENKVSILQGEAERQCLLRQELELELQAIKSHMQNVENAEGDAQRLLDENRAELEKTLNEMDRLARIVGKKDEEITQLKAHISEVNLHAEAQATEYKQKFKELEAMAEKGRSEGGSIQLTNLMPYKSEKNASKPRGSGSPFKCIGLGLAQQMKLEKDEELTALRMQIEELESLVINKQKEIFTLNAKLAATGSMTHDVIRDLLGVKLDVKSYASLFNNHLEEKKAEKAHIQSPKSPSQDVIELKKQLKQFIEERQGWLEEIDRKQAELVSIQIALEKHRQHDQLLKTENEMLKVENVNYKKKVRELEGEMSKLSGQQNLQQRIHHHAKIKEENNLLKIQNEELSIKFRRSEMILSRVKEELSQYRASIGKNPYINLDEEERLNIKLKEVEEERVQVAQKLLGLCVNVLKVAGFTKHASEVCPFDAEEALEGLKYKLSSMESELQDLKTKNRIINERIRLLELMPQQFSPVRTDENSCKTPRRVSQNPFHTSFDR